MNHAQNQSSPLPKAALIECETPRFGLWLREIQLIDPPIRLPGRQGIWNVEIPGEEIAA